MNTHIFERRVPGQNERQVVRLSAAHRAYHSESISRLPDVQARNQNATMI